jgi:alpha-mannosidase
MRHVERLVESALDANTAALAQAVQVSGPRIVVFNPLPWSRDCIVQAQRSESGVASSSATPSPMRLKDAATGEIVTAECVEGLVPTFVAKDVPSLGYRTFVPIGGNGLPQESALQADESLLENEFFRVQLDTGRGTVASLVDKRSGRELVDAQAVHGFGQYLYERFDADVDRAYLEAYCKTKPWPDWAEQFGKPDLPSAKEMPYSAVSPRDFRVSVRRGVVSHSVTMTADAGHNMPHGIRTTVTLWQGQPFVDVEVAIQGKTIDPWPEAGWLCFPLNVANPTFRLARLGSVIDPSKDIWPGANHEVFCLSGGMTVSGPDGAGVGLCPLQSPLVSLGHPGLLRYSKRWTPREPRVFVNLFNNVWGTNFQQWIADVPASSVRIWAAAPSDADLVRWSWESRRPVQAARFDGPAGPLPPICSGIGLSRDGVLITAFGPNPDGPGILLRLWEQIGSDSPCHLRLPAALHDRVAQPCNLRGVPCGEPIHCKGGAITIPLRRFAPTSVVLREYMG